MSAELVLAESSSLMLRFLIAEVGDSSASTDFLTLSVRLSENVSTDRVVDSSARDAGDANDSSSPSRPDVFLKMLMGDGPRFIACGIAMVSDRGLGTSSLGCLSCSSPPPPSSAGSVRIGGELLDRDLRLIPVREFGATAFGGAGKPLLASTLPSEPANCPLYDEEPPLEPPATPPGPPRPLFTAIAAAAAATSSSNWPSGLCVLMIFWKDGSMLPKLPPFSLIAVRLVPVSGDYVIL
ncbi:hypothetical protein OGAPHI_005342 [Ogataea philodendri]|uniref:Uncharacterized protein n=1 Tax=Ogataea philodendri TaxID=1378263 RepID=A0A9P8P1B6_9ASCO|nr:uncharacterized protein OGAPHI_005342 [Ogataea philodendri]KAH3663352.1 hypothetical protein OGAPHI_005342 [Ogataea philodendri]